MGQAIGIVAATATLLAGQPAHQRGTDVAKHSAPRRVQATAAQLLELAQAAQRGGDFETAENAYRAVAGDPIPSVRSEARFRLGMMYATLGRHAEAALLFRRILDEQPHAQRVRLELARTLDLLGDEGGARRALREAQAGGLPPEVVRFVDRYSAALRARKPFGASFEMAIAPDSNINRATRSDTLGTVIGDFTLEDDARRKSGVGLALRGQVYGRIELGERTNLLGRVATSTDMYRMKDFNDRAVTLSAGPELRLGGDRLTGELGVSWRRFGNRRLSRTMSVAATYLHPLDRVSQLRATASVGNIAHHLNPLQSGKSYAATLGYERALSATAGIGASIALDRQALRDRGYSSKSGQFTLFGYRELGATTLIATLGHGRLAADERLFVFPDRRRDRLYRASLGATLRQLEVGGFAPFIKVTREVNRSSIEIYDYRRTRTEFGITRAF